MATRAVIITIDNRLMNSTYNHYDGYPEYLGKALKTHYNSDELAKKISGEGYISYIDDETGEVNVSNPKDKDIKPRFSDFGGMDVDDMAYELAKEINGSGADYAYIWNQRGDNWVTVKNDGVRSTMNKLADELPTMGFDDEQDMMEKKDNMNEETFDQAFDRIDKEKEVYPGKYPVEKIISQAMFRLQDEPKQMLDAYKKSLANDIRLNGKETYADYDVEDFIEDYNEYINDKMPMEESVKLKWQHRAGIIK